MGYLLYSVISALSVSGDKCITNVVDAGGECAYKRPLSYCKVVGWGAFIAVLFLHYTCAVLYLL